VPKQTQIEFKDFLKAIVISAIRNFGKYRVIEKRGSGIRIELFKNKSDRTPCDMWTVHRDRYVWSKDLKKAYTKLGLTKEEFLDIMKSN
jgi:hypothetical protein